MNLSYVFILTSRSFICRIIGEASHLSAVCRQSLRWDVNSHKILFVIIKLTIQASFCCTCFYARQNVVPLCTNYAELFCALENSNMLWLNDIRWVWKTSHVGTACTRVITLRFLVISPFNRSLCPHELHHILKYMWFDDTCWVYRESPVGISLTRIVILTALVIWWKSYQNWLQI